MQPGPKSIVGLGSPAALRNLTPNKGGGVQARQWLIGGYAVKIGSYNILFS